MTREIKFRAWDEQRKEFMDNNIFFVYGNGDIGFTWSFPIAQKYTEKPPRAVLMQYTGLKDKNGKEIYEGDIIKGYEYIRTIQYRESFGAFRAMSTQSRGVPLYKSTLENMEIIGNTYENPELLKNHG